MGPRTKQEGASAAGRQIGRNTGRYRAGAGVAGAGAGALLVHILKVDAHSNEAWAQMLLYLSPSISLAVSAAVLWLRSQLESYGAIKAREREFDRNRKRIKAYLAQVDLSETNRTQGLKALDELDRLQLEFIRGFVR